MPRRPFSFCNAFIVTLSFSSICGAGAVLLPATKDNTLIQSATGSLSNGLGPIFCGRTGPMGGNTVLRSVVAFDLTASIPPRSTITNVQVRLQLEQGNGRDQTHALHRLLRNWGEGTSLGTGGGGAAATAGDATWIHTFYNTENWNLPGGDFIASSSASQIVGIKPGEIVWTSPQLIADVQAFVDRPGCNFGWVLIGNEVDSNTSKRFFSRETTDTLLRPALFINYMLPTGFCPGDINRSGATDVADLLSVISNWGACPACPSLCNADIAPLGNLDQQVSVADLLQVISNWGPCSP